jgi:hypothetical protein
MHTSKSVQCTHYIAVVLYFRNYLRKTNKFLTSGPTMTAHWFLACSKLVLYMNNELYLVHFCSNNETTYCMNIVGCLWEPEYPSNQGCKHPALQIAVAMKFLRYGTCSVSPF